MFKKIDHLGIAIKDIESATKVYEAFGIMSKETEVVEDQKVKVSFALVGDVRLEFLEATSEDSPIAKFIAKRGVGVHHISFAVDDIEKALEEMKKIGVVLIDEKPKIGAGGAKIAFLHPKSTGGILIELCEK